jgi:penicillin-binding protein 1C
MSRRRKILLKKRIKHKQGAAFFAPKFLVSLGIIIGCLAIFGTLGVTLFQSAYIYYSRDLPKAVIETEDYPEITRIYDRSGKLLFEDIGDEERIYIKVADVSPHFLKAILSAEDQHFFEHQGIDFWANLRVLWQNFRHSSIVGGASTITQQLVRNFFLNREISLSRKIKEMILASEIEKKYSKEQILEFYLNKISFGSNIYGIEAASRAFFGKSARFLSLAEAATLAPIPRAPNRLFPYKNPEELAEKKTELLERMYKKKIINEEELEQATKEEIIFRERSREIAAPHFVFYVLDNLKKIYSEEARERGIEVVTTLDLGLEEKIEALLKKTIDKYRYKYKINDGAIVVLDAKKGDILAMAGSYDFWQKDYGQYNGAVAERQPGSTLKPLIYTLAIGDLGWSKKTILDDKPMNFNGYKPRNFSGYFRGKVALETALVDSLNIPAIYTLNKVGVQNGFSALEDCHLTLNQEAGLSMAVGGASTNLLDLTSAYTVFVNKGKCFPSNYFIRLKEGSEKILIADQETGASQVFQEQAVSEIDSILKRTLKNFPEIRQFAYDPLLKNVGVKTGTSNGPRDLWAIGYNSDIIIGVWLGNDDNSLLKYNVYGVKLAVPLWADAMKIAIQNKPPNTIFKLD